ncbi:hypothetical protein TSUD_282670 [Trifolium subterraneum]|uniref:Ubiquitin-like protease family profile domain-containing protein n=1 Tax=Trifolium subterraneum TaxID=3900 RepID=A0A2Z6PQ91_TRISU|nr:hypothetical protein TSUD_282670 [Trifolium subterraneum]
MRVTSHADDGSVRHFYSVVQNDDDVRSMFSSTHGQEGPIYLYAHMELEQLKSHMEKEQKKFGVEDAILINGSSVKVDETLSDCVANKENDAEHISKELTLEVVMEEITSLKDLLYEMMKKQDYYFKGIADEIVGLKASCGSIEASIETIEKIVKLKVNGQQRFNEDLAQISVKHNSSIGGFSEKDMVDEVADVVASKISSSTLMHKPFLPERWLKANTTCNTKKIAKQTTLISKSDLKRNSHFKYFLDPRESCMVVESVSRKLYQTPSPKGTQDKCAKTSEKGQHSSSKDITELTMTSHKNTKSLGCIVPKLEAKFTCKPTYDMILAKRQPQVCAYLFQKTSDVKLMAEILVVSGELEATRADLQCLIPPRVISDLVITLAAKRITCIQVEQQQFTDRQAVWCLPPSFVIYVPLKSVDGHWFLMIVHLKDEVIYHLDTYCPGGFYLNIVVLPECLVLERWTKCAKDAINASNANSSSHRDPAFITTYVMFVERCKRMVKAAFDCGKLEDIRSTIEMVEKHTTVLEAIGKGESDDMRSFGLQTGRSVESNAQSQTHSENNGNYVDDEFFEDNNDWNLSMVKHYQVQMEMCFAWFERCDSAGNVVVLLCS